MLLSRSCVGLLSRFSSLSWYRINSKTICQTRMHSSGMCTACLLAISKHALGRGCLPGGCLPWGYLPRGVSAQRGAAKQGDICLVGNAVWRGVCLGDVCLWGCLPRGGVSAREVAGGVADIPAVVRHLWKHNLCKLCLPAVKWYLNWFSVF